jgi:hypothetical protein
VPAIVVRLLGDDGHWHETLASADQTGRLPVAVDRDGTIAVVELDPATLVGRRR